MLPLSLVSRIIEIILAKARQAPHRAESTGLVEGAGQLQAPQREGGFMDKRKGTYIANIAVVGLQPG